MGKDLFSSAETRGPDPRARVPLRGEEEEKEKEERSLLLEQKTVFQPPLAAEPGRNPSSPLLPQLRGVGSCR